MIVAMDEMPIDKVKFESLKCTHCGEGILTMKQLGALARKYTELRKSKDITFSKWGNSIAVRIPNEMAEALGIKEGKKGIITKEKKAIKITLSR